jgi:hypothetical protein
MDDWGWILLKKKETGFLKFKTIHLHKSSKWHGEG